MRRYKGKAGTNNSKAQPFVVKVHSSVLLLADIHAHVTMQEVIGFLAGRWDPDAMVLEVCRIFPGKSLQVSADPVSPSR